jgi:hypothetical protein
MDNTHKSEKSCKKVVDTKGKGERKKGKERRGRGFKDSRSQGEKRCEAQEARLKD